jgi:hypothetical protein
MTHHILAKYYKFKFEYATNIWYRYIDDNRYEIYQVNNILRIIIKNVYNCNSINDIIYISNKKELVEFLKKHFKQEYRIHKLKILNNEYR